VRKRERERVCERECAHTAEGGYTDENAIYCIRPEAHFQTPEGNNRGDAIHYILSQTTHANTHANTWSEDTRAWPSDAAATCCRYVEYIEIEWK